MKNDYYHLFCVRDSENSIKAVMQSLLNQTLQPKEIVVVDDGSTDNTSKILENFESEYPNFVKIIRTNSTTRDYRRIPKLWNMCLRKNYDYHMIGAGDCAYEKEYSEKLINKLAEDVNLVICSGHYGNSRIVSPHGAGRFVRQSFFYQFYDKYPEIIGYESEIIYRALFNNYKVRIFKEAKFEHLEQLGHGHNFEEFGKGMKSMGFHPLWVVGRTLREVILNESIGRKAAWKMFWYYLTFKPEPTGYFSLFPEDVRKQIRSLQKHEMEKKIIGLIKKH